MSTNRVYGQPIDTPLETEPNAGRVEAAEMWRIALLHVGVLGGWDRTITAWLAGKGPDVVATVASLLRRAWQAGLKAGRREALDEAGALRVELDRVTGQLATLTVDVRKVVADLVKAAPADPWACTDPIGDRLLAAVDAAVIDLGDAVEHLLDPPACPQCATPQCDRCPADVLAARVADRIATDAQVDAVRGYGGTADGDPADPQAVPARDRFVVFAGPAIGTAGRSAWCESWTADGHSVLPTAWVTVGQAVRALRTANPGAVVVRSVPARDSRVMAQAAAGGHFALDGDPDCPECARLSLDTDGGAS